MFDSFFLLTAEGEIFLEKHWISHTPRSVVIDYWTTHVAQGSAFEHKEPFLFTSKYHIAHYYINDLFLVLTFTTESFALAAMEFFQRFIYVIASYTETSSPNVNSIKTHFATVHELLDEMLDGGQPICTDVEALKEKIPTVGLMDRAKAVVGIDTSSSAANHDTHSMIVDGTLTTGSWRRPNTKHSTNEVLFDVVEELHAIIDAHGRTVAASITGSVQVQCRLSGMPELTFTWHHPEKIEDASVHPCVDSERYLQDRVITFTPPDGKFLLTSYRHVPNVDDFVLPFYVKPQITFHNEEGRVHILIGLRSNERLHTPGGGTSNSNPSAPIVAKIVVEVPLPPCTECLRSGDTNRGRYIYQPSRKCIMWYVDTLPSTGPATLSALLQLPQDKKGNSMGDGLHIGFEIVGTSMSGLMVQSITLSKENYRLFKGIKYVSKNGNVLIRTR